MSLIIVGPKNIMYIYTLSMQKKNIEGVMNIIEEIVFIQQSRNPCFIFDSLLDPYTNRQTILINRGQRLGAIPIFDQGFLIFATKILVFFLRIEISMLSPWNKSPLKDPGERARYRGTGLMGIRTWSGEKKMVSQIQGVNLGIHLH